ncbi:MAG: Mth938-like domain-containing protein [Rickettsiales bacterium]|nr:Mth938-like domain-containing protein [Rickettsiales bacterium]
MQDITPIIPANKKQIESYGDNVVTISGEKFYQTIFLTTENIFTFSKKFSSINEISISDLQEIPNLEKTEILLAGYGNSSNFFTKEVENYFRERKIPIEYMNNGAACRTYNILLSEGREVACLIFFN